MCKFAAQYVWNKGFSKGNLDYRFQWVNRRMQDRYMQGTILYVDAHIAECLCKADLITYQVNKNETSTSNKWILSSVVPNITRKYSNRVAFMLGWAL